MGDEKNTFYYKYKNLLGIFKMEIVNQEELSRIKKLSGIIHSSRPVYGKVYNDCCHCNTAHPTTVVIGKEPAHSFKERRQAKKELKRISKHCLGKNVRKTAIQELKLPNEFTPEESKSRTINDFLADHFFIDFGIFVFLFWFKIAAGAAMIYGVAKLYNYLSE
jgi:hypothetical protein